MDKNSRISGFYRLSVDERIGKVKEFSGLSEEEIATLKDGLGIDQADRMIENVIGKIQLPLGIATNFQINGKDYLVPMATEEPSVVAAASNAAKIARDGGGFIATTTDPVMIGQVQLVTEDPEAAAELILEKKDEIISLANQKDPMLVSLGGGVKDLKVRILKDLREMVIIHLHVDVRDAMGANAVNTMSEAISPFIEELTGGKIYLRIISNLATERIARSKCIMPKKILGEDVIDGIIKAYEFAAADIYRASTHNKGVMNGIDAVTVATGNDTRAVEAGVHTYASFKGAYAPVTRWYKNDDGDLEGDIEIPLAVGSFGGATMNPVARVMFKILGVTKATELAQVIASVGLAQNFAALKALSTEGIQRGHMALHAKNIAVMAGAKPDEVEAVSKKLVEAKRIQVDYAKEILANIRGEQM